MPNFSNSGFDRFLQQDTVLTNVVFNTSKDIGSTDPVDKFHHMATIRGWAWIGSTLSETVSLTEHGFALQILKDLSAFTSNEPNGPDHDRLNDIYSSTPGLTADRIKAVLGAVAEYLPGQKIVFAYDEVQNLSENAAKNQFPLAVLLDVFQAIQRQDLPYMLVLSGHSDLFFKMVETRTYAERMFRIYHSEAISGKSDSLDIV